MTIARMRSVAATTALSARSARARRPLRRAPCSPGTSGPAVDAARAPELALDENLFGGAHDAVGADDPKRLHAPAAAF